MHQPDLYIGCLACQPGRVPVGRSYIVGYRCLGIGHAQGSGTDTDRKKLVAVFGRLGINPQRKSK